MRMSDWSSDVCSSDLLAGDFEIGSSGDDPAKVELQGRFAFTLHPTARYLAEEGRNRQIHDGAQALNGHSLVDTPGWQNVEAAIPKIESASIRVRVGQYV